MQFIYHYKYIIRKEESFFSQGRHKEEKSKAKQAAFYGGKRSEKDSSSLLVWFTCRECILFWMEGKREK